MLFVRDIMVSSPIVVTPDAPVTEALRVMAERKINSIIVVREEQVEGILTPRDLVLRIPHSGTAAGAGPWDTVRVADVMTRDPITVDHDASFTEAAELMDAHGIRHLPVTRDGRIAGMLSVRDLMHHRTQYLEGVVEEQTAELQRRHDELAKTNRRMNYHVELAGRVQRQVLPRTYPDFEPLSVAATYEPFDRISGDCYDFALLSPDRLGILIADASGHGVSAAFVSVMARSIFQAFGRRDAAPSEILRTMNAEMPPLIEADHFITMCFAVIDRRTLRMTWATAGHPPPLWLHHHEGEVESLDGHGHLIGVLPDPVFDDKTVQLRPNDVVLFYTDGVIEARNGAGHSYGSERLAAALHEASRGRRDDGGIVRELSAVREDLTQFCGSQPAGDDVTLIAVLAPTPERWEEMLAAGTAEATRATGN